MTGKNPGKHGIFSFIFRRFGTYKRDIIQPEMIKSKTLWQILSENNKKVGVINIPMSDVGGINGFIIPGFLSRTEGIPYPEDVREKIRREFGITRLVGDVETEILKKVEKTPNLFLERVNQITDKTAKVSLFLLEEEDWDFFMTVFMGTDRIQHFFWRYVDETHEKYVENEFTREVKDYYIKIDRILNKFLKSIDNDVLVMVISDHGFCSINKEIVLNNYLKEFGFLKLNKGKIDIEKSLAISYGYGDIWLNVKGREPYGIINPVKEYENVRREIIYNLSKIKVNDEYPIKAIKRKEEVYWGDQLESAPDLITIFKTGWQAARHLEIINDESEFPINDNPKWNGGHDGTHDPIDVKGILCIKGVKMENLQSLKINLWDLAPTILRIMEVPVPKDMDGEPLPFI